MAKTVAIANQKGGVGKTTTAVNISACLAHVGQRVLLVDIDPQGNATSGAGIEKGDVEKCIYNVLVEDTDIRDIVRGTALEQLDVVPATIQLSGAEIELVSTISREIRLKNALKDVAAQYDYIIIDCPPSLGLLTINALSASDSILIPVQCEYYALEGLSQLLNEIQREAPVLVMGMTPVDEHVMPYADVLWYSNRDIEAMESAAAEACREADIPFLSLHGAMQDQPEWLSWMEPDGIHLNSDGHAWISSQVQTWSALLQWAQMDSLSTSMPVAL